MTKLTTAALLVLSMWGSGSLAADMPQKWLRAHAAPVVPIARSLISEPPACRDYSDPSSACCAVLQELTQSEQFDFLLRHPHCAPSNGGGGNNGGGSGGNNGGSGNGNGNGHGNSGGGDN